MRSDLQYRVSFALFTFSQFAITALDFVAILIVFTNVHALAGWSVQEVADMLRITPERVSDEKYKALRKLRAYLHERSPRDGQSA